MVLSWVCDYHFTFLPRYLYEKFLILYKNQKFKFIVVQVFNGVPDGRVYSGKLVTIVQGKPLRYFFFFFELMVVGMTMGPRSSWRSNRSLKVCVNSKGVMKHSFLTKTVSLVYAFNTIMKLFFSIVYTRIISLRLKFDDHPLVEYPQVLLFLRRSWHKDRTSLY